MSLTLNIKQDDAENIASCIKNIVGGVSASDIVEIVLKTPETGRVEGRAKEKKKPAVTMTSREVADLLGRTHTSVVKQIAKYLCEKQIDGEKNGFFLTSFISSHVNKRSYPMYEMTEGACKEYRNLVIEYGSGIKSVTKGIERLDREMSERFHPEVKTGIGVDIDSRFLLEGKPRSEYEGYCNIFNQFIAGPAVEGREIAELTEKYRKFYEVMKATQLEAKESNQLEDALYGVAIEAEMQGFIYGFKLFNALLNKQLAIVM